MNACPKCNSEYKTEDTECKKCGIIFEKYAALQKEQIAKKQSLMMKCNVCDKEISKNAVSCPHCGEPNKIEDTTNISSDEINKSSKEIIKCKKCGVVFHRNIEKCPKCGTPAQKQLTIGKLILGFVAFLILGSVLTNYHKKQVSNNNRSPAAITSAQWKLRQSLDVPAISINANALFSEYESNEVRADEKYKGRTLIVDGYIENIGKDIIDDMYITLKTENVIFKIQCFFDKTYTSALSNLKKEDFVTVSGQCRGKMGNVLIKDCTLK